MPPELLHLALTRLAADPQTTIRLSGCEPLLHPALLTQVFEHLAAHKNPLRLTSNGLLLSPDWLAVFAGLPTLELVVSVDGGAESHRAQRLTTTAGQDSYAWFTELAPLLRRFPRPVTINLVVGPSEADKLARNVAALFARRFFRLNLLPAYYVPWSPAELFALRQSFAQTAELIVGGLGRGWPIRLVNLERFVRHPLFSDGVVLDVDGALYDSELFMHQRLYPKRQAFAQGALSAWPRLGPAPDWSAVLAANFPPELLAANAQADAALGDFVAALRPWHERLGA